MTYYEQRNEMLDEYYRLIGKGNLKTASLLMADLFLLLSAQLDHLARPTGLTNGYQAAEALYPTEIAEHYVNEVDSIAPEPEQLEMFDAPPPRTRRVVAPIKQPLIRRPKSPDGMRRPRLTEQERRDRDAGLWNQSPAGE